VCANSFELVVGRSIRITSAFIGGKVRPKIFATESALGKFEDCQRPFSLAKLGALDVCAST
jgi:hypothetical protein